MKIIMSRNERDFNQNVSLIIAKQVLSDPKSVICFDVSLKTHEYYKSLISITECLKLDWSEIKACATYEYVGIDESHKSSVHEKLHNHIFDYVNIDKDNIFIPAPYGENVVPNCKDFEAAIKSLGGIDLMLLDLSSDGSIAMNIPHTLFNKDVFICDIDSSIVDEKGRFSIKEYYPKKSITMGIRLIMQSKTIVLTAKGANMARKVKAALSGDITPEVPASALQLHPNLIVLLDEDAASMMW